MLPPSARQAGGAGSASVRRGICPYQKPAGAFRQAVFPYSEGRHHGGGRQHPSPGGGGELYALLHGWLLPCKAVVGRSGRAAGGGFPPAGTRGRVIVERRTAGFDGENPSCMAFVRRYHGAASGRAGGQKCEVYPHRRHHGHFRRSADRPDGAAFGAAVPIGQASGQPQPGSDGEGCVPRQVQEQRIFPFRRAE